MTYKCEIDITKSLDWQRSNADKLINLVKLKQAWYEENHCGFWNDWVSNVFDLRTCDNFGLSVWAAILQVLIFDESVRSRTDYPAIFFGSFRKNFDNGNFGTNDSDTQSLTLVQKRTILQLKAISMFTNNSTADINKKLATVFGYQKIYVIDNLDMTYTYMINYPEIASAIEVIEELDVFPRPNCVKVNFVII